MRKTQVFLLVGFIFLSGIAGAEMVNKGASDITLNGGERGNVPFPHEQHQTVLKDCSICHALFPQKIGGITEMIEKGALKKKQIMNKQCTKCHRDRKKAGEASGPVSCSKCHVK